MQVFGRSYHPYGLDIMHGHSMTFNADALITLMDVWVFEPQGLQGTKWIPWYPIDTEPMPQVIYEKLQSALVSIAMSKYGLQQANNRDIDSLYVPCGVDTKVYHPVDQMQAREASFLPKDKFMIGMVAMNKGNPSRKAFYPTIAAFAALHKKYPDTVLYLHTMDGTRDSNSMVNIPEFCRQMGLKIAYTFINDVNNADVIIADQYRYALGYPPDVMANIYSAMDVFSLVTMGEGFGIPLVEAQACGVPVIVGDWTSMPELCFSGWKVNKKDAEPFFNNLHVFHYLPHAGAIAEAMEAAYQMRGNQDYRKRARQGALAYDPDKITEKYWKPALNVIESKLDMKPQPANLARNLDMLRVSA